MDLLVHAGAAVFVLVVLWAGARFSRPRGGNALEVWRALAKERGAALHEGAEGEGPTLELTSGEAVVRLDVCLVSERSFHDTFTRARARFAIGAGPTFRVMAERHLLDLAKAFIKQDVVLGRGEALGGDDAFDEAFVVRCEDVEAVRRAFTPRARALMCELEPHVAESDGEVVTVRVVGVLADPLQLEKLWTLAGELASLGAPST